MLHLDGPVLNVVAGGPTSASNLDVIELYNRKSNSWRQGAPLLLPQAGTASVFSGEILVPVTDVSKDGRLYALSTDSWTALPPMTISRYGSEFTLRTRKSTS